MAIRTTADAVSKIIEVDEDADLTPFIETASSLVDELLEPLGTMTDAKLELIERWLSAHYYAIHTPRAASEYATGVGESIETRVDLGLNVTRYGQQALILDTSGKLAQLQDNVTGKPKRKIGARWMGNPTEKNASYGDGGIS